MSAIPRRYGALAALMIVAVGMGAWWFLAGDRQADASLDGPDVAILRPAGKPAAPAPSGDASAPEPITTAPFRSDAERDAASARPFETPPADGQVVRVVAEPGETPVPGAEVFLLSPDLIDLEKSRALIRQGLDPEAIAERMGLRFQTDESGQVRVPRSSRPSTIVARSGRRMGAAVLAPDRREPLTVPIKAGRRLCIQVVDGSGRPREGVPLMIHAAGANRTANLVWTGTTATAQGLAEIRNLDRYLENLQSPLIVVDFAFPTVESRRITIDPQHLPPDPVVLVLPPTGEVTVEVTDLEGRPFAGQASCTLESAGADQESESRLSMPRSRPTPVEGGVARFPVVSLGMTVRARIESREEIQPVIVMGPGPRSAGEVTVLRARLGALRPILAGRLVGPDLIAVVNARFEHRLVLVQGGSSTVQSSEGQTDGEGRFRVIVRDPWVAQPLAERRIRFTLVDPSDRSSAEVVLSRELVSGANDLGDVRLETGTVLAAGLVVDPSGQPLSEVTVTASAIMEGKDSGEWHSAGGSIPNVRTDRSGAFALRGPGGTKTLRLTASKPGFAQDTSVECAAGTTGLTITLVVPGAIAGSLLLEPEIPSTALSLRVRNAAGQTVSPSVGWPAASALRPFRIEQLLPGKYEIAISTVSGIEEALFTAQDLVVTGGRVLEDPRLDRIDLRGKLHAFRVRVTDEAGQPIPGATVAIVGTNERRRFATDATGPSGEALLVTQAATIDLAVLATGFRTENVSGVTGDCLVTLRKGLSIKLVARGANLPASDDCSVSVRMVHKHGPSSRTGPGDDAQGRFDAQGEARLRAAGPGTHELRLFVHVRSAPTFRMGSLGGSRPVIIEVQDIPGEQVFDVPITAAALAAALEKIGR